MNVLSAALPEFLGSLGSGLVLGVAGWLVRRRCGNPHSVEPRAQRHSVPLVMSPWSGHPGAPADQAQLGRTSAEIAGEPDVIGGSGRNQEE